MHKGAFRGNIYNAQMITAFLQILFKKSNDGLVSALLAHIQLQKGIDPNLCVCAVCAGT